MLSLSPQKQTSSHHIASDSLVDFSWDYSVYVYLPTRQTGKFNGIMLLLWQMYPVPFRLLWHAFYDDTRSSLIITANRNPTQKLNQAVARTVFQCEKKKNLNGPIFITSKIIHRPVKNNRTVLNYRHNLHIHRAFVKDCLRRKKNSYWIRGRLILRSHRIKLVIKIEKRNVCDLLRLLAVDGLKMLSGWSRCFS